jgi:hypothetical protein
MLQEVPFATTHFDESSTMEVPTNDPCDFLEVMSEYVADSLLVLVVRVVLHQLRSEGLIEN